MNKILTELKKIMDNCLETHLPGVSRSNLENNGAVFYMNGNNGTEFDWYVNEKLSSFMIFYNDKENLGAVKATIYDRGEVVVYTYGSQGKELVNETQTSIDATEKEMLELAVLLRTKADDKLIWDKNIEDINTDNAPSSDAVKEFLAHAEFYQDMIQRRDMMGQIAYVSKKILEEGWKVGYMTRDESVRDNDSGWCFMAGNEDDAYNDDYKNIALMSIAEVTRLDPDVMAHITEPVGTALIRVSPDTLEIDHNDKPIFCQKRES